MSTSRTLPNHTADDFARDGVVVLRGVLSPAQIQQLVLGIEHNLAHPSALCRWPANPMDDALFPVVWRDGASAC